MRRRLACLCLVAAGCIPPTVDLSGKQCDSEGRCASGYTCVSGLCVVGACSAGDVQSCSSDATCSGPTRTCTATLQWGPCVEQGDGGAPLCPKQLGVCAGATELCGSDGQWQTCDAAAYTAHDPAYSTVELCDGLDNDCSGEVDENLPPHACSNQTGVCQGSIARCGGDAGWLPCSGDAGDYGPNWSPEERCDGLDNNCSGHADEDIPNPPLCANQTGVCKGSFSRCGGDAGWLPCSGDAGDYGPHWSPEEKCDGLDNNCSGDTDEDIPNRPLCANQTGVCKGSVSRCGGDAGWLPCSGDAGDYGPNWSPEERCDGLDNNCSGDTDEGIPNPPLCAKQEGVCQGATETCGGDAGWLTCTTANYLENNPSYSATPICSDLDVTCSGSIDATFACVKDANDGGACTTSCGSVGTSTCNGQCTAYACVPPMETCNGLDDDCSGVIGDGLTAGSAQQISNDASVSQSSDLLLGLDGGLVVYADNAAGPFQIYAQPVSADLAPTGSPNRVASTANDQTAPRLVATSGGYFVAWLENSRVEVVGLTAQGVAQGSSYQLGSGTSMAVSFALAATPPGSGAYLAAVWEDSSVTPARLAYETVGATGATNLTAINPSGDALSNPALAAALDGGALGLAYEDLAGGLFSIMEVGLTISGTVAGTPLALSGGNNGFSPTIAPTGSQFAVAWQAPVGSGFGIMVSTLSGSPQAVAPIPDGGGSNAGAPAVAAGPGGLGLAWQDDRATPGTTSIWTARLNADGSVGADTGGPAVQHIPLGGNAAAQQSPAITYSGATYGLSWEEVSASYDVFAQQICP